MAHLTPGGGGGGGGTQVLKGTCTERAGLGFPVDSCIRKCWSYFALARPRRQWGEMGYLD